MAGTYRGALTDDERAALDAVRAGDVEAWQRYGDRLDAADAALRDRLAAPDALGRAALWYALRGVAVFPLRPLDKRPANRDGFKGASADPGAVRSWWTRQPACNIGAPTGIRFDVIDVDGPTGAASLPDVAPLLAGYDVIGRAMTPRGLHVFTAPTGSRNGQSLMPGIDVRGVGGYVVLPPSVREDGKRYRWLEALDVSGWDGVA